MTTKFGKGWNLTTEDKAEILAEVMLDESDEYADFRRVYNIGLPLAFAYYHNIIEMQDSVLGYIESTYAALLDFEGEEPLPTEDEDDDTI